MPVNWETVVRNGLMNGRDAVVQLVCSVLKSEACDRSTRSRIANALYPKAGTYWDLDKDRDLLVWFHEACVSYGMLVGRSSDEIKGQLRGLMLKGRCGNDSR